jgi:hypothetical protein
MSIKSKFAVALAVLAVAASVALPTSQAQAKPKWGPAVGLGILGAAAVGTAIAATSGPVYVDGYRRCFWRPQYDVFGNFIGNVQVCRHYY